jgi:hypothetical protein
MCVREREVPVECEYPHLRWILTQIFSKVPRKVFLNLFLLLFFSLRRECTGTLTLEHLLHMIGALTLKNEQKSHDISKGIITLLTFFILLFLKLLLPFLLPTPLFFSQL